MHDALRFLLRTLAALLVCLIAAFLLAGCGGGGDAGTCQVLVQAPTAERTLSFDSPVGLLTAAGASPTGPATVHARGTLVLTGTGPHAVLVYLTTARPHEPGQSIGEAVTVQAGGPVHVRLSAPLQPGAQVVGLAYALVGASAEGQTLTTTTLTLEVCE
jgi:hypothetical protein